MISTDTEDSLYIRLIDENDKKSVERLLNVTHIRGETSNFTICTPRDENLAKLTCVELHQRERDTWYMDNVSLVYNRPSLFQCYFFFNTNALLVNHTSLGLRTQECNWKQFSLERINKI